MPKTTTKTDKPPDPNLNGDGYRVLTCVFCGMEYPQDTPSWGNQILVDHIKVCEKHPLRQAELKIEKLRQALIGLVGSGDLQELEQMELTIRSQAAPEQDKIAALNAINVLQEFCTPTSSSGTDSTAKDSDATSSPEVK